MMIMRKYTWCLDGFYRQRRSQGIIIVIIVIGPYKQIFPFHCKTWMASSDKDVVYGLMNIAPHHSFNHHDDFFNEVMISSFSCHQSFQNVSPPPFSCSAHLLHYQRFSFNFTWSVLLLWINWFLTQLSCYWSPMGTLVSLPYIIYYKLSNT